MTTRPLPRISARKQPQQARSEVLVSAILAAAIQVLERDGARGFTTTRVAERAGVSVGSLYQYFPNKAAILFRLQSDEWTATRDMLRDILANSAMPPLQRLRSLVHAFIRSECDEAAMRVALHDAAPLYRDTPEARRARASGARAVQTFMEEVLPNADERARSQAGALIKATLSAVGKNFSESPRKPAEIETFSGAMADMFCAYLRHLGAADPGPRKSRRARLS